jgi:hypothetical protein
MLMSRSAATVVNRVRAYQLRGIAVSFPMSC